MSYSQKLRERIKTVGSGLCVGLDPRPEGQSLQQLESLLAKVIEQTGPYAAAFKPNIAYFEALGWRGLELLEKVLGYIDPAIPVVLDVKRGDIGETQKYYAQAYFEQLKVDAVTLNPFMGYDTIEPFLDYADKGLYLLCVTSNAGAKDIECQSIIQNGYKLATSDIDDNDLEDKKVYHLVSDMCLRASKENAKAELGLVVGLTNAASQILDSIADVPLLIPGLGAQGGDVEALKNSRLQAPKLINVSRGIMYADSHLSYAEKAANYSKQLRDLL